MKLSIVFLLSVVLALAAPTLSHEEDYLSRIRGEGSLRRHLMMGGKGKGKGKGKGMMMMCPKTGTMAPTTQKKMMGMKGKGSSKASKTCAPTSAPTSQPTIAPTNGATTAAPV
jgi:hypothetical protein